MATESHPRPSALAYVHALNDAPVVFISDLARYGWEGIGASGYEAYSPMGEVRAFATRGEACAWRDAEVSAYLNPASVCGAMMRGHVCALDSGHDSNHQTTYRTTEWHGHVYPESISWADEFTTDHAL